MMSFCMFRFPNCDELPYRSMIVADAVEHLRGAADAADAAAAAGDPPATSRKSPELPLTPLWLMEPPRLG